MKTFHYRHLTLDFDKIRKMNDADLLSALATLAYVAEDEGYCRAQEEMISDTSLDDFDEDDFHSAIAGMSDY